MGHLTLTQRRALEILKRLEATGKVTEQAWDDACLTDPVFCWLADLESESCDT